MYRIAAASLLLMLAGCAGRDQVASYDDPSQPIEVEPGAEFEVSLVSNQSTGYQWVLVDSAALGPVRPAGSRYEVPRELRDRDGAGGREHWTFRAEGAGNGVISLIYVRPWENTAPKDTTRFRVTVR